MKDNEREALRLLGHAATYITLASALHPYKPTYKQALGIVRHMLPQQVGPAFQGSAISSRFHCLHTCQTGSVVMCC